MSHDWYAKKLGGAPTVRPAAPLPAPTGQIGQIGQSNAPAQGTAAEQAWHGNRGHEAGEVIRTYRGSVGAQHAVTSCPNCGSPDGYVADMPAVGNVQEGGRVNPNVIVGQNQGRVAKGNTCAMDAPRTAHCFYCGFRSSSRGAPVDGVGYDGVTTKGEVRPSRGANIATRIGNAMRVDRSLVS
jgi:hypothetical protein